MGRSRKHQNPIKISIDIETEVASTIEALKKAYGFKSRGAVITLAVETFYAAFLDKVARDADRER